MSIPLALITALIAFFIISKSANLMVRAVVHLAHLFHISEFSIGFFVLGLATSTPEIFVGIQAAVNGHPELSLGNLVGATIVLLTLIIGLNAVISKEIRFVASFNAKDMWLTSFVIASPILFILDGYVSRFDGVALISIYTVFYMVMNRNQTFVAKVAESLSHHPHISKSLLFMALGILGLTLSSKLLVDAVEFLAVSWQLPLVVIGLLVVSIGTNMPEFMLLFSSVRSAHKQIGMGDFLGSAVANTPILGMVALLSPIQIGEPLKVYLSFGMLILTLIMFNAFFSLDKKLTRVEGFALISLYVFFLISEVFLKNQV